MKKQLLFLLMMGAALASHAQYTLSGTVTNSLTAPVSGATVYILGDSVMTGSTWGGSFYTSVTTNASGGYTYTMPGTVSTGQVIHVSTANCTGSAMYNTYTYAGSNITSNFTVCLPPKITGKVRTSGIGAADAKVYLIKKVIDSLSGTPGAYNLTALDSTLTDGSGNYTMAYPSNIYGSLLVKGALLPASANYSSYLPSYYDSSLVWSGATTLPAAYANVTADITLKAGVNPGGPGFIGGSVLLGANKTSAVGDPLPNRQIMITDANNVPVAYTYSDGAGMFNFPNLAYGTYKIFGDVFSKTSTPLTITLSASNQKIDDVVFEEKSKSFNPSLNVATGITNVNGISAVSVYPNPVKNLLTVSGIAKGSAVNVFDIYGKKVLTTTATQSVEVINTNMLAPGTYLLQVTDVTGNKLNQKIVKE